MCATRGAEAAKKASEVPSTLSLLARRGDLQKTRAVTELMDPYATNEVAFSSSHNFYDDCCSSRLNNLLIEITSTTRPAPRFLTNFADTEFPGQVNIFDESEHARLQRLYEIRHIHREQQGGEPDDFADALSDADLYLPAEFEPSPDFLPRRRDELRHHVEDHIGFNARLHDGAHVMDFGCAARIRRIAGIRVERVGDHGRGSDTRACQRVFRDADAIEQLPDSSRPCAAHAELDGMRESDDALERAFDDLVKRFAAAPALEAPLGTTVQCLLLPSAHAVSSSMPATVAFSVPASGESRRHAHESVSFPLPFLSAITVPTDLAAFAVWYARNAHSAAGRTDSGVSRCITDFHFVMKKAWGLMQRSQVDRFERHIRPPAMEAPTDQFQLFSDAGLHLSHQHVTRNPAEERCVLPGPAVTSANEDHPVLVATAVSLSPVITTAMLATVAPDIYATDGAGGPCQPIVSMNAASAFAAPGVLPSLAIASSAQHVGGFRCGHPLRAYDPGGGLPQQPYGHGKGAPFRQLLHGSSPASLVALPMPRVHDMHSTRCEYDRQDSRSLVRCGRSPSRHNAGDLCYDCHGHRPRRHGCGDPKSIRWHDRRRRHARTGDAAPSRSAHGRDSSTDREERCADFADYDERRRNFPDGVGLDSVVVCAMHSICTAATALPAPVTVSSFDETVVSSTATTVMAAHEHGPIRVPASSVCCSTDGHAMSVNDRSACRADPPAPAPAVAILQCPRQEHTDDGRCKVVQSSKRVGPHVQHFAPILAIEMDSTSNMETIVPFLQPVRAELI